MPSLLATFNSPSDIHFIPNLDDRLAATISFSHVNTVFFLFKSPSVSSFQITEPESHSPSSTLSGFTSKFLCNSEAISEISFLTIKETDSFLKKLQILSKKVSEPILISKTGLV